MSHMRSSSAIAAKTEPCAEGARSASSRTPEPEGTTVTPEGPWTRISRHGPLAPNDVRQIVVGREAHHDVHVGESEIGVKEG